MPRSPRILQRAASPLHAFPPCWTALIATIVCLVLGGNAPFPFAALAQESTPIGAVSESTSGSQLAAASSWLREQQGPDGGFLGFSGEPDPGTTTDAVMALYAVRESDPEATAALDAAVAIPTLSPGLTWSRR